MLDSNWNAGQAVFLAIAVGAIAAIVVYLVRAFRGPGQRPWPTFFVGVYNILLLLLYLFGMMTQESSEGFGFLPLMALTLPWSWLLDWSISHLGVARIDFLEGGSSRYIFRHLYYSQRICGLSK